MIRLTLVALSLIGTVAAQEPFRLMTPEQDAGYRKLFPNVKDQTLKQILTDKRLILYTNAELPKAHQDWEGSMQGVLDSSFNISANRSEPKGNGNKEFPWETPAGVHLSGDAVHGVRGLLLPKVDGHVLPVAYFPTEKYVYGTRIIGGVQTAFDPAAFREGWAWTFPKGTVLVEILFQRDAEGYDHVFEIRTRTRSLEKWVVNAHRPFPTALSLVEAIKQRPRWKDDAKLVQLVNHLRSPLESESFTLVDAQPDQKVFDQHRQVDVLPAISQKVVGELLDEATFQPALGVTWRGEGADAPHAPTTKADFHVVPKNYTAGFIDVSSKSCMQCHDSTNKPVMEFDVHRDWYGRVRGSDGIFSFHPFEPKTVTRHTETVTFNAVMARAGIIARFDPSIHREAHYRRIEGLK